MDLQQLQAMGAVKDRRLVKKKIDVKYFPLLPEAEWSQPGVPEYGKELVEHSLDAYIRKRSSADSIEVYRAESRHQAHLLVLRCVLNEKGEQVFPDLETVESLEEWLFMPLIKAVNEVNNFGPKSSPLKTSGGVKSRSHSGARASKSGKKRSAMKNGASGSPTSPNTGH